MRERGGGGEGGREGGREGGSGRERGEEREAGRKGRQTGREAVHHTKDAGGRLESENASLGLKDAGDGKCRSHTGDGKLAI